MLKEERHQAIQATQVLGRGRHCALCILRLGQIHAAQQYRAFQRMQCHVGAIDRRDLRTAFQRLAHHGAAQRSTRPCDRDSLA